MSFMNVSGVTHAQLDAGDERRTPSVIRGRARGVAPGQPANLSVVLRGVAPGLPVNLSVVLAHVGIDSVYVLALPKRKAHVRFVLKRLGIHDARFVPPVMKSELKVENLVREGIISRGWANHSGFSLGRVACHMGIRNSLALFLQDPSARGGLFLQDDVYPSTSPQVLASRLLQTSALGPWDALYLGRCWAKCQHQKRFTPNIVLSGDQKCNHAIAFSRRAAQAIFDRTTTQTDASDRMISRLLRRRKYIYAFSPALLVQARGRFGSTIGNSFPHPECIDPNRRATRFKNGEVRATWGRAQWRSHQKVRWRASWANRSWVSLNATGWLWRMQAARECRQQFQDEGAPVDHCISRLRSDRALSKVA